MREYIFEAEKVDWLDAYRVNEVKGEIVRCKGCINWGYNGDTHRCFVWCVYTSGEGYCYRAERKEE